MINVVLLILSSVVGLMLLEFGARHLAAEPRGSQLYTQQLIDAHVSLNTVTSDRRLMARMPPNAPGHDKNGFRNASIPQSVDVVAIGDSQTWGINADVTETWPSMLGTLTNSSVYSMALGSWGPLQYDLLTDDALNMSPKIIVVGLYFGNDIFDSCNHVYGTESYNRYKNRNELSSIKSDLHQLLDRLKSVDDGAVRDQYARAYLQQLSTDPLTQSIKTLADHSMVVRILMSRGILPSIPSTEQLYVIASRAWAKEHPDAAMVYHKGGISTTMTFGYRRVGVDLDNKCIKDGVRITKDVFDSIASKVRNAKVRILFVFIPTKELVYATMDKDLLASAHHNYKDLVLKETAIKRGLQEHCDANGMRCIDATPWLVDAANHGFQLYRVDSDGHPMPLGYRYIAMAAREGIISSVTVPLRQ
jgi:hypothetical protein